MPTLTEAIQQAMAEDLEHKSYDTLHSWDNEISESSYSGNSSFIAFNKKSRVAVVQSSDRKRAGPSRGWLLSSDECFNCHEKGHYRCECPELKISNVKFVLNSNQNKRKRKDYCTYYE